MGERRKQEDKRNGEKREVDEEAEWKDWKSETDTNWKYAS